MDEEDLTWDDMYTTSKEDIISIQNQNPSFPTEQHIYFKNNNGKYERLCNGFEKDEKVEFWEAVDKRPSVSEGWEDPDELGAYHSCSYCAEIAHRIVNKK